MTLRTIVFWLHLLIGISAGLVVLLMSVTGVMLTYELQLNRWALREYRSAPVQEGRHLSIETLLERVVASEPRAMPVTVTWLADPLEPVEIGLEQGGTLFVDRYSGHVRGHGNTWVRSFLRQVMYWHRWLAMDGDYRLFGRTLTALANMGLLCLAMTGVYLWWPRRQGWGLLRKCVRFRSGLRGKARDFHWHEFIGGWVVVPLLVIAFSGAAVSYRWVGNLVHWLVGESPPAIASTVPAGDDGAWGERVGEPSDYATLVERAVGGEIDWRAVTLQLPETDFAPVTIAVDRGNGRQPSLQHEVTLDRFTGDVLSRGGYDTFSPGFKIRRWLRFAHTGEVYGIVGQTVAGLASAGACVLVWTGLSLSWRRFFRSAVK